MHLLILDTHVHRDPRDRGFVYLLCMQRDECFIPIIIMKHFKLLRAGVSDPAAFPQEKMLELIPSS